MFGMVIERVLLPDMAKVTVERERKIVVVGTARVLCEAAVLLQPPYRALWPQLLQALIQMVAAIPSAAGADAGAAEPAEALAAAAAATYGAGGADADGGDGPGYQAAFAQLQFAQPQLPDALADVPDAVQALIGGLKAFEKQRPGELAQLLGAVATDQQQQLVGYGSKYGVTLV